MCFARMLMLMRLHPHLLPCLPQHQYLALLVLLELLREWVLVFRFSRVDQLELLGAHMGQMPDHLS